MKPISFFILLFLSTQLPAQNKPVWVTNINIVNTSTGKIQPGMTIMLEGNTIKQVVKYNAKTKASDSVTVVNGTG